MKKNELEHYEARIELLEIENQELKDELDDALHENDCLWDLLKAIKRRGEDE